MGENMFVSIAASLFCAASSYFGTVTGALGTGLGCLLSSVPGYSSGSSESTDVLSDELVKLLKSTKETDIIKNM